MLRRLRLKFVCINMLIVTGILCVTFGLIYHFVRLDLEEESIRMMQSIADRPIQLGLPGKLPEEIRLPYFIIHTGPGAGETAVVTHGDYDLSDAELLKDLLDAALRSKEPTGVLEGYDLRFYRVVRPGEERIIFADMSSERATLENLLVTSFVVGTVSFFSFLAISFLLARWAVRPVERTWAQQRQFVADASHELKTPLTVIMTNAEMLAGPGQEESARSRSAESILTMSRQMRGLVEGLLELARADAGQSKDTYETLDFSKLVSDALLPFEPLLFEAGLTLESQVEPGLSVLGSASQLRQVVGVLLDNAAKYTSPNGEVFLSLRRGRSRCQLAVATDGEPLSREELTDIFKRFYRADRARSMNHSYGLGLAIAEEIVCAHHGRIWAESGGGKNTFFVELPVG